MSESGNQQPRYGAQSPWNTHTSNQRQNPAYRQQQQYHQTPGYQQQAYNVNSQHVEAAKPHKLSEITKDPPPGIDFTLFQWFCAVDRDNSGQITCDELRIALLNSNWSHFSPETCRLLIGMYDKDNSGCIDIYEFADLWKYIQSWKALFDRFDMDRSGTIDGYELNQALHTEGLRFSPEFCSTVIKAFDRNGERTIKFENFIQASVMIKNLMIIFNRADTDKNGVVKLNYENFMSMHLDNRL